MKKKNIIAVVFLFLTVGLIAATNLQKLPINNFLNGLDKTKTPSKLSSGFSPNCYNVIASETGSISKRKGYIQKMGFAPDNVWVYPKSTGEEFTVFSQDDKLYYSVNLETVTLITSGLSEQNPVRAAIINDKIWFTNGVDPVGNWSGPNSTYQTFDFIPQSDKRCKYILSYDNRLVLGNASGEASRMWYSRIFDDEANILTPEDSEAWSPSQSIYFGKNDGDSISGLFKLKGILHVPKNNSVWSARAYSDTNWAINRISDYYGFPWIDTVKYYKNGIIGATNQNNYVYFDGSFFQEVSRPLKSVFDNLRNFEGKESFLQLTNTSDFSDGTLNDVDIDLQEIKLEEKSIKFGSSNYSTGTFTRTKGDTKLHLDVLQDSTTRFYQVSQDEYGGGINFTYGTYSNPYNANDRIDNYINTKADRVDWEVSNVQQNETFELIDIPVGSIKLSKLSLKLRIYAEFFWIVEVKNSPVGKEAKNAIKDGGEVVKKNTLSLDTNMRVTLTYTDGTTDEIDNVLLTEYSNPKIERYYYTANCISRNVFKTCTEWEIFQRWKAKNTKNKILNIDIDNINTNKEVTNINLEFTQDSDTYARYNIDGEANAKKSYTKSRIDEVYDISVYELDETPVYYSSGTYVSNAVDFEEEYLWNKIKNIDDLQINGSTINYFTSSSTDNINWEGWKSVEIDTFTNTEGVIKSTSGRYIKLKMDFVAENSTYPGCNFYRADITGIKSSGSWKSGNYDIGSIDGGWNLFVANDNGLQNIEHRIYLSTSQTGLSSVDYSTYTSGDLISGTTNQSWLKHELYLNSDDGTENPTIYDLTYSWYPVKKPVEPVSYVYEGQYRTAVTTSIASNNLEYIYDDNGAWWENRGMDIEGYFEKDNNFYFYNSSGIYQADTSYSDDGSDIKILYETPDIVMNQDNRVVDLQYIDLQALQTGATVQVAWKPRDYTTDYSTSNVNLEGNGVDIYKVNVPVMRNGKVFRFRLLEESTNYVEIQEIEPYFVPRGWKR